MKTRPFAAWPIPALLLILSAFPFAGVAHGQSAETVARVLKVLDFDRTYVARVDALIDQTADKPRIWSGSQSPEARRQRQAEVRETLLQKRADVKARLHEALLARFIDQNALLAGVITHYQQGPPALRPRCSHAFVATRHENRAYFRPLWSRCHLLFAGLETENKFDHLGGGHFARLQSAKLLAIEPCPFAILRPLDGHAPWSITKMSVDITVRYFRKRVFKRRLG